MSKVMRRIGFLYPAMYSDEKNTLHTMVYTDKGRCKPEGVETTSLMSISELVAYIRVIQRGELPYDLFIVDTYGRNKTVMNALKAIGIPAVSIQVIAMGK